MYKNNNANKNIINKPLCSKIFVDQLLRSYRSNNKLKY